jgi:hypothetical protein
MTPQSRPFLMASVFVFALFLCGGIGATADQAQVQTWTPNSASAIPPPGDDDSRKSNTNCYPCKEWEAYPDGGGKWVDLDDVPPAECPPSPAPTRRDTSTPDPLPDHLNPCKTCKDGEVDDKSDGTSVDAGDGCGCCKDGQLWAPEPDCTDPMDINFSFVRIGDCPCSGNELGCMDPGVAARPDSSVCYEKCKWKPAPKDFKVYYKSSTCPNRCRANIGSVSDVDANNYCAAKKALEERIEKEKNWATNPPPPPLPDDPPKPLEPFCFSGCIATHEEEHVKQMKQLWKDYEDKIRRVLSSISIDFNCDTTQKPEDAGKLMAKQIGKEMDKIGKDFAKEWDEQVVENEKKAYLASLKCLEDLLKQVHALGVSCP